MERNAKEIRAYMAADMKLHDYLEMVDVDMPRLLDAAVKLRRLFYGIDTWQDKERILAETAWLAETPEEGEG